MTDSCVMEQKNQATQRCGEQNCRGYRPAADIIEQADAFVVRADVPGATAKDLSIEFEKGVLSLLRGRGPARAEGRQAAGAGVRRRRFHAGVPYWRGHRHGGRLGGVREWRAHLAAAQGGSGQAAQDRGQVMRLSIS